MAAETATATEPCKIEVRFHAPVHLLACSKRGRAATALPASRDCRDPRCGTTDASSSSCRPVTNTMIGRSPPASPAPPISISIRVLLARSGRADVSLAPRLFFEDAGLWDIAIRLKALVEGPGDIDRLYCESLGVVLAHELVASRLRRGTHVRVSGPRRARWLAATRRRELYRGARRRSDLARHPRPARSPEPVSFQPGVQADVRHAAASISHAAVASSAPSRCWRTRRRRSRRSV